MATKSILLASAEPQALVHIVEALGAGWEATSVGTEADVLEQFEKRSFNAFLVDFNLGSGDASDLLNQVAEKSSNTIRFLFAYEADLALVAAKVLGSYHILPKPLEPASVKSRVESGVEEAESRQKPSAPAEAVNESPAAASIYAEVLRAIETPGTTDEQVGEMIADDSSLAWELLRLTHSSYQGVARNLTDPVGAVEVLGLETVKALIMALQFLAEHRRLKPGYLSFDRVWDHSVCVGQIARDLVLFETKDRALASQALVAGLVHDLGKVLLVVNFGDLYGRVHSLAHKQPVAIWDVEKEMFGANHGEIGACLAGMWNLPSVVVDAIALHHEPPLGEQEQLTPLGAVHIANVLEHELRPNTDDPMVGPIISAQYLNELGLLQRLPVWRATFANRRPAGLAPELESSETSSSGSAIVSGSPDSRTANQLPGPAAPTRTTTSGQPDSAEADPSVEAARARKRRVSIAVVAGVLLLLALWLGTQPDMDESEPVYARTPTARPAPVTVAIVSAPESAPPAAAAVISTPPVSEEPPTPEALPAPDSEAANPLPTPEPTPVITPPTTSSTQAAVTPAATNAVPGAAPREKPVPGFRLNAIIYTTVRPTAIINGEAVNVGDQVNGATVVSIGRTAVTLQSNGQRKTYELR